MKISKVLKELEETFVAGYEGVGDRYYEIFKNPTEREIRSESIGSKVRFIAVDNLKEVYVADMHVLHDSMVRKVDSLRSGDRIEQFAGIGGVEGGKIEILDITEYFYGKYRHGDKEPLQNIVKDLRNGKWDWVKRENFIFNPDRLADKIEENLVSRGLESE